MQTKILSIVLLGASLCCVAACDEPASAERRAIGLAAEMANDSAQAAWASRQRQALADTEIQSRVLARARASVNESKNLKIPRDAAICFRARDLMQADLSDAMCSGGEFGPALDAWHAQSKGVEMFCTYALTVGSPNGGQVTHSERHGR